MKNVTFKIEANKLKIEVDLSKDFGLSKSQKTIVVATSQGNVALGRDDLKLGLNVYKPK